jgi:hypothetical protein
VPCEGAPFGGDLLENKDGIETRYKIEGKDRASTVREKGKKCKQTINVELTLANWRS